MIKNIAIENLYKHPNNPRKDLGDLSELAESIKENGILQNLTVVQMDENNYRIIIGHRRAAAAKKAGLTEVPCAVMEMDEPTQMATMLLENIQRSDLTVVEQAEGFQMMFDLGETMEDITKKTGFSESTVRRRIKLLELDRSELNKSIEKNISLEEYEKLSKIEDKDLKNECLRQIGTSNFNWYIRDAMHREEKEKKKKAFIKQAEEFAIRLPKETDRNELIYITYIGALNDSDVTAPDDYDPERTYYYEVNANGVTIYARKTETELCEEESEKALKDARDRENALRKEELREAEKTAYELRSKFVQNYNGNTKHIARLADELGSRILKNASFAWQWNVRFCNQFFADPVNIDEAKNKMEALHPAKILLSAVYAMYADSAEVRYSGYSGEYKANEDLNELYELLSDIGYKMSEEEIKLKCGTHDAYAIE